MLTGSWDLFIGVDDFLSKSKSTSFQVPRPKCACDRKDIREGGREQLPKLQSCGEDAAQNGNVSPQEAGACLPAGISIVGIFANALKMAESRRA